MNLSTIRASDPGSQGKRPLSAFSPSFLPSERVVAFDSMVATLILLPEDESDMAGAGAELGANLFDVHAALLALQHAPPPALLPPQYYGMQPLKALFPQALPPATVLESIGAAVSSLPGIAGLTPLSYGTHFDNLLQCEAVTRAHTIPRYDFITPPLCRDAASGGAGGGGGAGTGSGIAAATAAQAASVVSSRLRHPSALSSSSPARHRLAADHLNEVILDVPGVSAGRPYVEVGARVRLRGQLSRPLPAGVVIEVEGRVLSVDLNASTVRVRLPSRVRTSCCLQCLREVRTESAMIGAAIHAVLPCGHTVLCTAHAAAMWQRVQLATASSASATLSPDSLPTCPFCGVDVRGMCAGLTDQHMTWRASDVIPAWAPFAIMAGHQLLLAQPPYPADPKTAFVPQPLWGVSEDSSLMWSRNWLVRIVEPLHHYVSQRVCVQELGHSLYGALTHPLGDRTLLPRFFPSPNFLPLSFQASAATNGQLTNLALSCSLSRFPSLPKELRGSQVQWDLALLAASVLNSQPPHAQSATASATMPSASPADTDESAAALWRAIVKEQQKHADSLALLTGLVASLISMPAASGATGFLPPQAPLSVDEVTVDAVHSAMHELVRPVSTWVNPQLNEVQRGAVQAVVSGACGPMPYLLLGSAGTGKSLLIVELVIQLILRIRSGTHSEPQHPQFILVAAPSDPAADLLVAGLAKHSRLLRAAGLRPGTELLRLNRPNRRVDSVLQPAAVLPFCHLDSFGGFKALSPHHLLTCQLVVADLNSAPLLRAIPSSMPHVVLHTLISHCIVDEVAQSTEAELALALSMCGPSTRVLLAGDPRQLGPTVESQPALLKGLGVSIQERLLTVPGPMPATLPAPAPVASAAVGVGPVSPSSSEPTASAATAAASASELLPTGVRVPVYSTLMQQALTSVHPDTSGAAAAVATSAPTGGSATLYAAAHTHIKEKLDSIQTQVTSMLARHTKDTYKAAVRVLFGLDSVSGNVGGGGGGDGAGGAGGHAASAAAPESPPVDPLACAFHTTLTVNYRSHSELLKIPSRLFYSGIPLLSMTDPSVQTAAAEWELLSKFRLRPRGTLGVAVSPLNQLPLLVVGVQGRDVKADIRSVDNDCRNEDEAAAVVFVVRSLLAQSTVAAMHPPPPAVRLWHLQKAATAFVPAACDYPAASPPLPRVLGLSEGDIGVIAPYRAAVVSIRLALRAASLYNVSVGLIGAFQGQEKRVIVMCTVLSSACGPPLIAIAAGQAREQAARGLQALTPPQGFFFNNKALNVAITRAMSALVCIGDPQQWLADPNLRALLQSAVLDGAYVGYKGTPLPAGIQLPT